MLGATFRCYGLLIIKIPRGNLGTTDTSKCLARGQFGFLTKNIVCDYTFKSMFSCRLKLVMYNLFDYRLTVVQIGLAINSFS